jgi:two-component system response regulator AtoC
MDRKARVLVVDDEEPQRSILCRWLIGWGYDVSEAVSAEAAIEMMEAIPADIIITDIMMPLHDGVWLLQQVHERWPSTVVIMESGAQNTEIVLEARRFGAHDFLAKPFGREVLRQALARVAAQPGSDPSSELGA